MQLCLSHLVDLALGRPDSVEGENFNILHTLLHVMLRKLNLSDAAVEITDDHAARAQILLNQLPKEPSISFKEFTFRNGVRCKKRFSNQLTAKHSLVQINKKWPIFSPNSCETSSPPYTPSDDSKDLMENLDAVNRKVMALENQLTNVTRQFEIQNRISNCALHDFEKLKNEFEILTCDFQSFKGSKGNAEEDQSNYSDCEIDENDMDCVEEIKWLKERMLEFSESLKFQSECLKNLQCMEIPQMQNSLDGKLESLEKSVDALNKKQNKRSDAQKGSEMKEIKAQLECFKCQISCIRNQMEDFQKHLVENQDMTCEELSALRQELMEKIQNNFSQISMKATSNHISTQNDQNSLPDLSNTSQPSKDENDEGVSDSKTYENEKSDNSLTKTIVNSINQRLCEIQKQVMSQSVCMQQLVRDLSCKVDRHEFECHIRKINDTIDALVQLKHDIQTAGTNAAGACLPMSCISCQAPTNMSSGPSNIPKLPPLRYGRENILGGCSQNELNCSYSDAQRSLQSSNWNCYNFKPEPRKAGGYNTKGGFPGLFTRMYRRQQ